MDSTATSAPPDPPAVPTVLTAPRHLGPVWVGMLMVLLLLALMPLLLWRQHQQLQQQTLEEIGRHAAAIEEQTTEALDGVADALSHLGEQLVGSGSSGDPAMLAQGLFWMVKAQPALRDLAVLDLNGRVLASSSLAEVGAQIDLARLGMLPPAGQPTLGRLVLSRGLMPLSRDATTVGGQGAGFLPMALHLLPARGPALLVLAQLDPEVFATIQTVRLPHQSLAAFLVSRRGELIASPPWVSGSAGRSLASAPVFGQHNGVEMPNRFVGLGVQPVPSLVAVQGSTQWPVMVVVERSVASVNSLLWTYAWAEMAALGTGVLCVMLLTWLTWRRLGRAGAARQAAALKQAQALQALVEGLQDALFRTDASGVITYINKRLPAFDRAELPSSVGRHVRDIVGGQHHAVLDRLFAVDGPPGLRSASLTVQGPYGEVRSMEVAALPVWEAGQTSGFICTARDLTERMQGQAELQSALEQVQALMAALPVSVFVLDGEGRYEAVNPAWEQMTGRSREEVLGRSGTVFMGAEEIAQHREHNHRLQARGGVVRYWTVFQGRPMAVAKVAIPGAAGQADGILGVYIDLVGFGPADGLVPVPPAPAPALVADAELVKEQE